MAELEPLSPNPFAPTQDQQVGYAKCYMGSIKGSCTTELRVGFFFDGTNNNKYRDTPKQANSNVARLHDIYEANQDQLRYYVPGIGTPFEKETSDTGRGYHARAGLGAGWGGEARINWALLQVTDALYRRYFDRNLSVEMGTNDLDIVRRISTDLHLTPAYLAAAGNDEVEQLSNASTGLTIASVLNTATAVPRHQQRRDELKRRRDFVSQKVKPLLASQKPTMQRIRLYVFGFSRGAAEARVFSNWLKDALDDDMTLAGLKVEFDFLGIFDTVASVGLAQSSMIADGHGSWGEEVFLRIPKYVTRTVHLISSHEVRGSFPLDKAASKNCLELAYPGVHTDVGGAYQPGDQGRGCNAAGVPDDSNKLSQVTLAKMYREAIAAGVPLNPAAKNLAPEVTAALKISPELIRAFNDYVDAVNPLIRKAGGGTTGAARVQYGQYLRWRRLRLSSGAQAFENQPFFKRAQQFGAQCAQDLKGANEELRDEAKTMAEKEGALVYSDNWMAKVLSRASPATEAAAEFQRFLWGEKVKQWREVKPYWNDTSPLDPRIAKIYDDYVHDSRAWFKPFGAANDSVWRLQQKARMERLKQWDAEWKKIDADVQRDPEGTLKRFAPVDEGGRGEMYPPSVFGTDRIDLDRYLKDGTLPLEKEGRESSSVWGYLRWRTHYAATPTLSERAQAAWDRVAAVPGKVADKVSEKVGEVVHSAEDSLARTASKLLSAGQESLERGAKNVLEQYLGGGGTPRL
ncbi:hypothetical protein GO281_00696 [Ralstonia solanacearum]|nr:hypothetical protein [Ralstonia solanacearum]